jgi:small subunit ribosomal protein S12
MPTINQLLRKKTKRKKKLFLNKTPALNKNPQQKGICEKVFTCSPKKPNSAVRKLVKVKLWSKIFIDVYIPGEGHSLKKFNNVLVRGGRTQDLPGLKYKAIRGKYDFEGLLARKTRRSLYGTKKNQKKN